MITEENTEVGTTEINEILDALELLLSTAGEVLADGKIDLTDLASALTLLNNYKVFVNAVDNVSGVIDEAKDIDQTEAMEIGIRVYSIIKNVISVAKKA